MQRLPQARRGVILLVILGMLALFMLIGVSFVVTSTHARTGALAAMSAEQSGDSPERSISMALLNVVRGSRSPRSAIGPHSILEDMYGEHDAVVGVIRYAASNIPPSLSSNTFNFPQSNTGTPTAGLDHYNSRGELLPVVGISFGPDRVPGIPGVDDNKDNLYDNNADAISSNMGQAVQGSDDFYLGSQPPPGQTAGGMPQYGLGADALMGHYAGRVLTMIDGPLARQSTRIVWFYPVLSNSSFYWILVLRPFSPGLPPNNNAVTGVYDIATAMTGHAFVINGRPFNGQGFGYNPMNGAIAYAGSANNVGQGVNPNLLNASHALFEANPPIAADSLLPFALLPNPTHRMYRDYLTDRSMYTSTGAMTKQGTSINVFPYSAQNVKGNNNSVSPGMDYQSSTPGSNFFGLDADEDYDAPDYQNLHIAWRVWNPTTGSPLNYSNPTQAGPGGKWQTRSPSFHRPELVNYWLQQCMINSSTNAMSNILSIPQGANWNMIPGGESSNSSLMPRLRQRIILRPDPQDNFDPLTQDTNGNGRWDAAEPFTDINANGVWDPGEPHAYGTGNNYQLGEPEWSGNMYFNPINGPWDVDNDNDGEADSIWLDLGAPVQTTPDGRQYKALFAVLCLDMDGRLNINAHGNNSQVYYASYNSPAALTGMSMTPATDFSDDTIVLGMKRTHSYRSTLPESPIYKPMPTNGPFAGLRQQPNGRPLTTGFLYGYTGTYKGTNADIVPVGTGLGFSVSDVNLGPLFGPPSHTYDPNANTDAYKVRWATYRFLLQGRALNGSLRAKTSSLQSVKEPTPGRYGEPHLLNYKTPLIMLSAMPVGSPNMPNGSLGYWPGGHYLPAAGVTFGQQQNNVPDAYDDNVPATASSALLQVLPNIMNLRGNAAEATIPTPYTPMYTQYNYITQGAYGSPVDPYGKLSIALDFRGQPIYMNLPHPMVNELVDDPWELDLSPKGKRSSYQMLSNSSTSPNTLPFASDQPFTPGELETLLRLGDPDLASLQERPVHLFALMYNDAATSVNLRNRVTTESWDLPCPSITPTPEIRRGLQMLGLPSTNCSFADLVRGKIAYVQGLSNAPNPMTGTQGNPQALAIANQQALYLLNGRTVQVGYLPTPKVAVPQLLQAVVLPAFSPDLLMGLRMNLNRTFGNAWDDNQNGAIDDPGELQMLATAFTERMWALNPPSGNNSNVGYRPDANQDGIPNYNWLPSYAVDAASAVNNNIVMAYDRAARSEMAKQLYMLMMLLTDSDWMYWYPTTQSYLPASAGGDMPVLGMFATGSPPTSTVPPMGYQNTMTNAPPGGTFTLGSPICQPVQYAYPAYLINARQKLAAYRIAQWAVNAVDFCDRDAIMTPFEFDLSPFNIDGYSVDGNLGSCASGWLALPSNVSSNSLSSLTASFVEPDRAVVWGMEFPDLLITETSAFHDKAWANTADDNGIKKVMPAKAPTTNKTPYDPNWDQARLPQGSLFVELYCPGKPNTQIWQTQANEVGGLSLPNPNAGNMNYPGSANLAYLPAELYNVVTPVSNYLVGQGATLNSIQSAANNPGSPANSNVGTLDLERLTPKYPTVPPNSGTGPAYPQYPVWRLALGGTTNNPRPPGVGSGQTGQQAQAILNPTIAHPSFPVTGAVNPAISPIKTQSVQNRFMTRPDTSTVLPLTVLSIHPTTAAYSQRSLALMNYTFIGQGAALSWENLDSFVLTDFIDSTVTSVKNSPSANLQDHVAFLQRFVYFARIPAQANNNQPIPAYPPFHYCYQNSPGNIINEAPPSAIVGASTTIHPTQAVYQPRPSTTLINPPHFLLHPGSYAVVGPRRSSFSPASVTSGAQNEDITFVGCNNDGSVKNWHPQAIDLRTHMYPYHLMNPVCMLTPINGNSNAQPYKFGGYPDNTQIVSTKIKNPLGIPTASGTYPAGLIPKPASSTSTARMDHGLNISEPPQGYNGTKVPTPTLPNTYTSGNSGTPMVVKVNDGFTAGQLPDKPIDADPTVSEELWSSANNAPGGGTGTMSRTLLDYSTVFLQRLADPTMPWDPTINPYITIDWMPVDLTVFNGQNSYKGTLVDTNDMSIAGPTPSVPPMGGTTQVTKTTTGVTTPGDFCFETRQRGPRNTTQSSTADTDAAFAPLLSGAPTPASAASYTDSMPAATSTTATTGGGYRWPVTSVQGNPECFVLPKSPALTSETWTKNYGYIQTPVGVINLPNYYSVNEAPLWSCMSDDPRDTPASVISSSSLAAPTVMGTAAADCSFNKMLFGTLGFLNEGYGLVEFSGTPTAAGTLPRGSPSAIDSSTTTTSYFNNAQFIQRFQYVPLPSRYDFVGDPQRPFPWLTWNNRPYSSAMELLLVPASQPARLGWEYTYKTMYTDAQALRPDPLSIQGMPAVPGGVLWDSHYAWRPNPSWAGWRLPSSPGFIANTTGSTTGTGATAAVSYTTTGALNYPPAPAVNFYNGIPHSFLNPPQQPALMYTPATTALAATSPYLQGGYPFGHLLNFFGSNGPQACTSGSIFPNLPASASSSNNAPIDPLVGPPGVLPASGLDPNLNYVPGTQPASNFHRIFEYVHVPSRFSGTQEMLDPQVFNNPANPNSAMSHFLVPFNKVSRYREPGKINLNTISDTWLKGNTYTTAVNYPAPYWFYHQPDIFQGIMNDFPGYQYLWDNMLGGLHVLDPRGPDKAWGFARNYVLPSKNQNPTGDDDGQADIYGFPESDDQWEAGWPGWPSASGSNASDDWIPAALNNPQGQQMLIAGASNERLLNHLYNFTGPSAAATADLPPGSAFGAIAARPQIGTPLPTFFANPFRSFCTSYGVPIQQMFYSWAAVPSISGSGGGMPLNGNRVGLTTYPMPFYWADSSLFRRARIHPTRRYEPLFVYNSLNWWTPGVNSPLLYSWESALVSNPASALQIFNNIFAVNYPDALMRNLPHSPNMSNINNTIEQAAPSEFTESFRDSNRNPYFRYQPLMKLGNVATSRSNVYAIWVTVGYFEVQRARLDQQNPQATYDRCPDGYRLVRELGSDTGNVKRHRGFALFDRTLPVGFLRGENLNVNDAFLVKHMIE